MRRLAWLFLALLLVGFPSSGARAQSADINDAIPAVVRIRGCDVSGCNKALGSGVIVDPSGIILTAYHVTLQDPADPNSPRLSDFVIERTDDGTVQPLAEYRARIAASDVVEDFALLEIYGDVDATGRFDLDEVELPALDLAMQRLGIGEPLHFLGYPTVGGSFISYEAATLSGYTAADVFRVRGSLGQGHSGGPALIERDGRFQVVGVVQSGRERDLGSATLIRSVASLPGLAWSPQARRARVDNVRVEVGPGEIGQMLQIAADVTGVALAGRSLDLLAYGFDGQTRTPWTGASPELSTAAGKQLVLTTQVILVGFADRTEGIAVTVPVDQLGEEIDRLALRLILWDRESERVLWQDNRWHRPQLVNVLTAQASMETEAPSPTATLTSRATATPISTTPLTPARSSTAMATETPTPEPTLTATSTPWPPVSSGTVQLLEPSAGAVLDANDKKTFSWTALPGGLPANTLYELVFWESGQDSMNDGRSPIGASSKTSVGVDLADADSNVDLGSIVDPGQTTCWGVRLWNVTERKADRMLSIGCRPFVYTSDGGGDGIILNAIPPNR